MWVLWDTEASRCALSPEALARERGGRHQKVAPVTALEAWSGPNLWQLTKADALHLSCWKERCWVLLPGGSQVLCVHDARQRRRCVSPRSVAEHGGDRSQHGQQLVETFAAAAKVLYTPFRGISLSFSPFLFFFFFSREPVF